MSESLARQQRREDFSGVDGDGLGEGEVAFEGEERWWEEDCHAREKHPEISCVGGPGIDPRGVCRINLRLPCIGSLDKRRAGGFSAPAPEDSRRVPERAQANIQTPHRGEHGERKKEKGTRRIARL